MERKSCLRYNKYLYTLKNPVSCCYCDFSCLPKEMLKHVRLAHTEQAGKCLWCMQVLGDEPYLHRRVCVEKKYKSVHKKSTTGAPIPSISMEIDDSAPKEAKWTVPAEVRTDLVCNNEDIDLWFKQKDSLRRNLFGNATFASAGLYGDLNPAEYPEWLTNEEGVAAEDLKFFRNEFPMDRELSQYDPFLQRAYSFKRNLIWAHLSVRVSAWSSFMSFLQTFGHRMYFLPYWCLCKGGREHHRHMLMVMPRAEKEVWTQFGRIRSDNKQRNEKEKFKRVLDPERHPCHLSNLISYMSNTSSKCRWEAEKMDEVNDAVQSDSYRGYQAFVKNDGQCHYYINMPVIPHLTLFSMLYLETGSDSYLTVRLDSILLFLFLMFFVCRTGTRILRGCRWRLCARRATGGSAMLVT